MRREPNPDRGFTLIELLIVIVILGILATVVVFAVGGITNRGEDSAQAADEKTLVTAQEAHYAQEGSYASEADLVTAGLLRAESELHDITLAGGDYTLTYVGPGGSTPATPTGTPISFGGYDGVVFGTLPAVPLAILVPGGAGDVAAWNAFLSTADETTIPPLFLITDPSFSGFADLSDFNTEFNLVQAGFGLFPGLLTPASGEVGALLVGNGDLPFPADPGGQWLDWDATSISDMLTLSGY